MKKLVMLVLVAMGGCFSMSDGEEADCFGLRRTEQPCVFRTPGIAGYECSKLRSVSYDGAILPADSVIFNCREPDTESTIQIIRPQGEVCSDYLVGGCR